MQYRLSGPDVQEVRRRALDLANVVAQDSRLNVPTFDWNEPGKVLRVQILQDKARQLGVTSQDIAGLLNGIAGGQSITQVRDSIYLVDVIGRARAAERTSSTRCRACRSGCPTARSCRCSPSPPSATTWSSPSSGAATGCRP